MNINDFVVYILRMNKIIILILMLYAAEILVTSFLELMTRYSSFVYKFFQISLIGV